MLFPLGDSIISTREVKPSFGKNIETLIERADLMERKVFNSPG
jgi:hypothetical protein